jgi:hypothetical protein
MSELSQEIAAKLKADQQAQTIQDAKFVEQQRLKRVNGWSVWKDARDAVKSECEELNRDTGRETAVFEVAPSSALTVRATVGERQKQLRAEYDAEGHVLQWECGNQRGRWHLATLGNGSVTFVRGQEAASITAQEIAEQLLKTLFET